MANPTSQERRRLARQAILRAGGQQSAKHRRRAFGKIAAALPINPATGAPLNLQAVEHWYRNGRIPRQHVSAVAALAKLRLHEVDPLEFPPPAKRA